MAKEYSIINMYGRFTYWERLKSKKKQKTFLQCNFDFGSVFSQQPENESVVSIQDM